MVNKKNKILGNLGVSYFKRIFKVINGPVFVSVFFTRDCNFNCHYCSALNDNPSKVIQEAASPVCKNTLPSEATSILQTALTPPQYEAMSFCHTGL